MKKSLLSVIVDSIFFSAITFIASFIVLCYFVNRPYSFIFSGTLSAITLLFSLMILNAKRNKSNLKFHDKKECEQVMFSLSLLKPVSVATLFNKAFYNAGIDSERTGDAVYISYNKTYVFPVFNADGIKKSDVVKIFNTLKKDERAEIYCEKCTDEITAFIKKFGKSLSVKLKDDAYYLLKKNNALPPVIKELPSSKFRPKFNNFILKKRAGNFFLFGLAFVFLSLFVPFKIYYLVFGTLFLILSAICKIFGKKQTENQNSI